MGKVITQDTIREAKAQGHSELLLAPGTIVTVLARELAQDIGVRLVAPGEEPRPSDEDAVRAAVVSALGHAPEGLDAAVAKVVGAMGDAAPVKDYGPFVSGLIQRARQANRHVVLCEGTEERVLRAAAELLSYRACRLTLLGEVDAVRDAARRFGVDISAAAIVDPANSEHTERFAAEFQALRAHKGVTLEQARKQLLDVSYFGTMMVQLGLADGMVSGAVHTTADTIRPALQIIKTTPDVSSVSSAFLLVLRDQVLVAADCAVIPNPTAAQLAEIAVSAAQTASRFGVEPRVAMLSYSTGTSGSGPSVDLVQEATQLAKQAAPKLLLDGPLQYDAAVNPTVGERKLPGSPVAGKANVLVFPDLNSGNIAYKAIQQSGNALAIGPLLLGLRRPVNDLSRSATVEDIVNTVVATAIQAEG